MSEIEYSHDFDHSRDDQGHRDASDRYSRGWISRGPPGLDESLTEPSDNLNEVLLVNAYRGWNHERLHHLRRGLAQRQSRPIVNVWNVSPPRPSTREARSDDAGPSHYHKSKRSKSQSHKNKNDHIHYHSKHKRKFITSSTSSEERHKHKEAERQVDLYLDEKMMDDSKREEYELMLQMLEERETTTASAASVYFKANEDIFGPMSTTKFKLTKGYDSAMLPGEADVIVQYVQANKRIPRRGEVGHTAEEIEAYEALGFQMSGSRHRRMNVVRIRKENQFLYHGHQRQRAQAHAIERVKRENQLQAELRSLLNSKLKEETTSTI